MTDLDREIELYKAKAAFYKSRKIQEYNDTARELNFVVELLEKLRSERPKGEWLHNDKLNMYYCKDCGLLEPFTKEEIEEGCKLPNFCEQCGADMRKGVIQNESKS